MDKGWGRLMTPIEKKNLRVSFEVIESEYKASLKESANTLGKRSAFWEMNKSRYLNTPSEKPPSRAIITTYVANELEEENGPNNLPALNRWFADIDRDHAVRVGKLLVSPTIVNLNALIADVFPGHIEMFGEVPTETGPSPEPFTLPDEFGTVSALTGIRAMETEDDGDCGVHAFLNATCPRFRRLNNVNKSDFVKYCRIELFPKLVVRYGVARDLATGIFYDRSEIQEITIGTGTGAGAGTGTGAGTEAGTGTGTGTGTRTRPETTLESFARHLRETRPSAKSNLFLTNEELQALFRLFQESMCCLVVHVNAETREMGFYVYTFPVLGKNTCYITTNVGPTYNLRQVNHFMSCTINGSYTMPLANTRRANEQLQTRYPEGGRPRYVADTNRNAEIARKMAEKWSRPSAASAASKTPSVIASKTAVASKSAVAPKSATSVWDYEPNYKEIEALLDLWNIVGTSKDELKVKLYGKSLSKILAKLNETYSVKKGSVVLPMFNGMTLSDILSALTARWGRGGRRGTRHGKRTAQHRRQRRQTRRLF
jgi:hypothetical protein